MTAVVNPLAHRREATPVWWMGTIAATVLAGGTIVLIWAVAAPIGPEICALSYPAPRNCFAADRAAAATLWTSIVTITYAATLCAALFARQRRFVIPGIALLALAPLASYLAVAWIPAFAL